MYVHFALGVERNCNITSALFDRGGRQSVLAQLHNIFVTVHVCDDASTASAWAVAHYKKKSRNKKFKRISKRNLPNVGMAGWMDALTDKVHKIYSDFVDYRFIDL